jgi:hypothetical protein
MEADERRRWTLLTSHGHVLVEIARNPQARVREISAIIGITERSTQAIIADLEQAGYVERVRVGRRTNYVLNVDNPFRHSAQDGLQVGPFLELLTGTMSPEPAVNPVVPMDPVIPMDPVVPMDPAVPAVPTVPVVPVTPATPLVADI